jgi:hypothetical protein
MTTLESIPSPFCKSFLTPKLKEGWADCDTSVEAMEIAMLERTSMFGKGAFRIGSEEEFDKMQGRLKNKFSELEATHRRQANSKYNLKYNPQIKKSYEREKNGYRKQAIREIRLAKHDLEVNFRIRRVTSVLDNILKLFNTQGNGNWHKKEDGEALYRSLAVIALCLQKCQVNLEINGKDDINLFFHHFYEKDDPVVLGRMKRYKPDSADKVIYPERGMPSVSYFQDLVITVNNEEEVDKNWNKIERTLSLKPSERCDSIAWGRPWGFWLPSETERNLTVTKKLFCEALEVIKFYLKNNDSIILRVDELEIRPDDERSMPTFVKLAKEDENIKKQLESDCFFGSVCLRTEDYEIEKLVTEDWEKKKDDAGRVRHLLRSFHRLQ